MNPLLAAGDPFEHTWNTWDLNLYFVKLNLKAIPGFETLGITNFVVMMLCSAALLLFIGIKAGNEAKRAVAEGRSSRGIGAVVEVFLQFIRDDMMRPNMPHHWKSPFLISLFCTFFFFIVLTNLIGLAPPPFGHTATGTIFVTGALAFGGTLVAIVGAGFYEHGVGGYVAHLAPPSPWWVRWPLLLPIEIIGVLVKPVSLTLRLAANMTAGHIILAVIMNFLAMGFSAVALIVIPVSAFGWAAITIFEVAIAFIQAYIFTVLSCVFVGASLSHEH